MKLLLLCTLRDVFRHPWIAALCVAGIAAGVALIVAIDLAIKSSETAFKLSTDALRGTATHRIVGGPDGVPDEFYRSLRIESGFRQSAPVIEADVRTTDSRQEWVRILGIDPYAEADFRPGFQALDQAATGPDQLLTRPGAVLISARRAERLGIAHEDRIELVVGGSVTPVTVVGFYALPGEAASSPDDVFVADVATAQEILQQTGRLSAIDLVIEDGPPGREVIDQLTTALRGNLRLVRAGSEGASDDLLAAFKQNLEFLSLLALVVAAFLVYNTSTFSVVRQRELYGRLRALGVSSLEIVSMVTLQAVALGALGTLLGLLGGTWLGSSLVGIVSRTINDLYFVVSVNDMTVGTSTFVKGIGLGLGATLCASLLPAAEAARSPLRRVLSRADIEVRAGRKAPRWAIAGVAAMGIATVLLFIPSWGLMGCQAALGFFIIGFAWVTPLFTMLLSAATRPVMSKVFGMTGRMAARGIRTSLSRTSVAVGALGIALALTLSVGQMIGTFRESVVGWLGRTLAADVYVTVPRPVAGGRNDAQLDPALVDLITSVPGVASVTTNRTVRIRTGDKSCTLTALGLDPDRPRGFTFTQGTPEDIWNRFDHEDCVLISEPFAHKNGLRVDDWLPLDTDKGAQDFRIAGVFVDFTSEQGYTAISDATYRRHWADRAVTALGIFAEPGSNLVDRIRDQVGNRPGLTIQSQKELRESSIEIFDRTFTITAVLRLLSGVVAFIGVFSALMSIQLERAREIGVLRAAGLSRGGVAGLGLAQSGVLGLLAGIAAVPLGILFTWVLTVPVNKRSFGWTLPFDVTGEALLWTVAFGVVSALAAGLVPALMMSRLEPARALRGEG